MSSQVTKNSSKNLRCILLIERSESEKTLYGVIPTVIHSDEGKTMQTVKRSVVPGGKGRE